MTNQLLDLASELESLVSCGFNGHQAAATMTEVAYRIRQLDAQHARLIAAAPEMLVHLKWLIEAHDTEAEDEWMAWVNCRRIVAEVEGTAP